MKFHADGYLTKPVSEADVERELDALEQLHRKPKGAKRIRSPIAFARSKSKELPAYLIDRRGQAAPRRIWRTYSGRTEGTIVNVKNSPQSSDGK